MPKGFTEEDDALLAELGVEVEAKKTAARTPREERIIAGFEEILRFVEKNGRAPQHGEDRDIFERLYAARLDQLRELNEGEDLIAPLDLHGLLTDMASPKLSEIDNLDDDALLAELGIEVAASDITKLKHVRSSADKKAAEEIAGRNKCEDFDKFRPFFEQVQKELDAGLRETRKFELKAEIEAGRFFIVGGQKAYVAEKGEVTINDQGRTDARLRVIFDNGTESNMLMRSLQRSLNADGEAGRRITEPTAGPLFSDQSADGDEVSGTIYVLRSQSDHPMVAENRELIHKIGVTSNDVEKRVAGAQLQTTFLMAKVDIVATYDLYNINRTKLENLLHRIFAPAQLDIEIPDRLGRPMKPKEWFLVPLFVIEEAVERIKDGTIASYIYDRKTASLVLRG
ncbi:GIY-YIG nuclease family protein [Aliiroseovarius sp. KMU-50]|uniref:GIY-YIG nuclease family protein n=1 Tax=Aliiroseovarius salicola TaxID=3009082 RepID=A0ABT4W185_9RHOB|nr:GIY-YIG nuclease family protein [Aliiroseovarius sp. KMU-50]MDA5094221.1 GIY-YIG nuclease family protein [Aliiroseovarius sp. KMU-50]